MSKFKKIDVTPDYAKRDLDNAMAKIERLAKAADVIRGMIPASLMEHIQENEIYQLLDKDVANEKVVREVLSRVYPVPAGLDVDAWKGMLGLSEEIKEFISATDKTVQVGSPFDNIRKDAYRALSPSSGTPSNPAYIIRWSGGGYSATDEVIKRLAGIYKIFIESSDENDFVNQFTVMFETMKPMDKFMAASGFPYHGKSPFWTGKNARFVRDGEVNVVEVLKLYRKSN